MRFKDVKIGQLFSEDSSCEILLKVSETESHVYDADKREVFRNHTGTPVAYEFPYQLEVEEYREK